MNFVLVSVLSVLIFYVKADIDVSELRCLVCDALINELSNKVSKIDPTSKVDVGSYRLDEKGNIKHKSVSKAKSELYLSELMDEICTSMDDYVRATSKDNGTLMLLKLIENGKMNPLMSAVDIIQDDDLNKSLKHNCEVILEYHEEDIIKSVQNDSVGKFCTIKAKLCPEKTTESKQEL